jgi:acetyltransferase-like isoleucine patch superfamily enzyme
VQGKFKCLGDIRDLCFGPDCTLTREPWPLFDVNGSEIVFGKNVVVSSGVHILTHDHQFSKRNWRDLDEVKSDRPTFICDNVFLGVNVLIMPSCKYIGHNSVIGAGAVVTKDVPDCEIWVGNPAVKIGDVE